MCILCVYVYMCGGNAGVCVCVQTWPEEGTRFPPLSLSAYPFEAEYSINVWVSQNITKSHVITKFFKTSIIWFYVTTLGSLVFGFGSAKQCRVWVPNHWVVLEYSKFFVDDTFTLCSTIVLADPAGITPLQVKQFVVGLEFTLLFWWCTEYHFCTKDTRA